MKFSYLIVCFLLANLMGSLAFALPNPAAVNCIDKNGKSILQKSQGICVFKDGTYCEEWAFFRGQCKPGQMKWIDNNNHSK